METVFRPKKRKQIEPKIPERIRRIEQVCDDHGHKYKRNKTEDKWELQTSIYAQKYAANVEKELKTVLRVRVPPGQFELDQEGTIDDKHTVKEALVYAVQTRVMDPQNPYTEILSASSTKIGVYKRPFFVEEKDDLGNVTNSTIQLQKTMFYIPFTEENVQKVLEEFDGKYRKLGLAVAVKGSAESWYGHTTYTVFNLGEFLHEHFDSVIEANTHKFLRKGEEQGVQKYLKDKAEKQVKARAELEEFKKRSGGKNK
ncbi:MAG: hypothetical protein WA941_13065 [Nitrososphaeraceae archaeon]